MLKYKGKKEGTDILTVDEKKKKANVQKFIDLYEISQGVLSERGLPVQTFSCLLQQFTPTFLNRSSHFFLNVLQSLLSIWSPLFLMQD